MRFNKLNNINDRKLSVIVEIIFIIVLLMTLTKLYKTSTYSVYERNTYIALSIFITILALLNYSKVTCCLTFVSILIFFYLLSRTKEGFDDKNRGIIKDIEDIGEDTLHIGEDTIDDISKLFEGEQNDDDDDDDDDDDEYDDEDDDDDDDDDDDEDDRHPSDLEKDKVHKEYEDCMYNTQYDNEDEHHSNKKEKYCPHCDSKRGKCPHCDSGGNNCPHKKPSHHKCPHPKPPHPKPPHPKPPQPKPPQPKPPHPKPPQPKPPSKLLKKVKKNVNTLASVTDTLRKMIHKFYRLVSDKNLRDKKAKKARDNYNDFYKSSILLENYADHINELNNHTTPKLLKYIKSMLKTIDNIDIDDTVKSKYKYSSEEKSVLKDIDSNITDVTSKLKSLKSFLQ